MLPVIASKIQENPGSQIAMFFYCAISLALGVLYFYCAILKVLEANRLPIHISLHARAFLLHPAKTPPGVLLKPNRLKVVKKACVVDHFSMIW